MPTMGVAELLVLVTPLALVAFIFWVALSRRRDRQQRQAEVQKEIISKFTSSAEMQAFLATDEGRTLFKNLGAENRTSRSLRERAISRIGVGIVLLIVGAGLMVLAHYADQPQILAGSGSPSGPLLDVGPGVGFPAAVLFLTGAGLIISSLVMLRFNADDRPNS